MTITDETPPSKLTSVTLGTVLLNVAVDNIGGVCVVRRPARVRNVVHPVGRDGRRRDGEQAHDGRYPELKPHDAGDSWPVVGVEDKLKLASEDIPN